MKTAYKLNIGGRETQQDNCKVLTSSSSTFLVLGDGMGGHKGGAKASETLIKYASIKYNQHKGKVLNPKFFFQSIINETFQVLKNYKQVNKNTDPQTTCVLVLIQDSKVYSMHIGDSRVYILDTMKFIWRTKDHSVVEMLLSLGEITEKEMATHPDQNRLLKSLNGNKKSQGTFKITLLPEGKSMVLVCSDGFWEYISVKEMKQYGFNLSIEKALSTMVLLARKRGGIKGDNISVALSIEEVLKKNQQKNLFTRFISKLIPILINR
ncbi:Protein serine/threonine phosphatase PrpC, regulation of stationary phase [hydrothermal vent metagenome]|uniref:Protein serine/threonine phosphatase PrpC, regulation of stationary phase n=1 Tax=hydrothermal vent metagenome TaxID=652676 RepID=A0A1W1CSG1_9ZZZZ